MFTEVFIPVNQLKDSFLVDLIKCDMDTLTVEYKGEEYYLPWWEQYGYYRGKVGDIEGYIV